MIVCQQIGQNMLRKTGTHTTERKTEGSGQKPGEADGTVSKTLAQTPVE